VLPLALEICRLFGGFFLPPASLPKYFVWLDALSYVKYSYEGVRCDACSRLCAEGRCFCSAGVRVKREVVEARVWMCTWEARARALVAQRAPSASQSTCSALAALTLLLPAPPMSPAPFPGPFPASFLHWTPS
jgi:hypothetical protein